MSKKKEVKAPTVGYAFMDDSLGIELSDIRDTPEKALDHLLEEYGTVRGFSLYKIIEIPHEIKVEVKDVEA